MQNHLSVKKQKICHIVGSDAAIGGWWCAVVGAGGGGEDQARGHHRAQARPLSIEPVMIKSSAIYPAEPRDSPSSLPLNLEIHHHHHDHPELGSSRVPRSIELESRA